MIDSSESDTSKTVFTVIEAAIRLGLLLLLATWCFLIVSPFVLPIMWGIIIAVAVFPLFAKLKSALGGRNKLAATVYTLVAVRPKFSMWSYAFLTMIVILAPAVLDSPGGSGAEIWSRIGLFIIIALYGTTAVAVFNAFWPARSLADRKDSK